MSAGRRTRAGRAGVAAALLAMAGALFGCNAILGLGDVAVVPAETGDASGGDGAADVQAQSDAPLDGFVGECTTNRECTERATREGPLDAGAGEGGGDATADARTDAAADGSAIAAVCLRPQQKCVRLLSADCTGITGPYLDDNAVVLGTLFSVKGSQAATNTARQNSALLAAEEINAAGGLPAAKDGGARRPLVVVSCDETADLVRVGNHLANELHVPAIVGPNTSQDTLDLSQKVSVPAGMLVMSPTAVASSIADLDDKNLTWRLVPSDVQRSPLMIKQINDLETSLQSARGKAALKLAIIYKNDALGIATLNSMSAMTFNGVRLSDAFNADKVKVDAYDPLAADQSAIVTKYRDFAPDIVALVGTAEAVTKVLQPLETAWTFDAGAGASRPYYVLTDSSKVTELLTAVTGNDDLRLRVRGTGVTPASSSVPVFTAFKLTYQTRFGGSGDISGMGPSYDSMYALAYSIASLQEQPITGANVAVGLRQLTGGATVLDVGSQKILAAFQLLGQGQKITAVGTFGPLEWDSRGDTLGVIEMWCIRPGAPPVFASSGLTYNTKTQLFGGSYAQCN